MLDVENIDVYYGSSQVLNGISLQVRPGEPVCVLGKNGVGKTTLLKSIMGLIPPQRGKISLDGECLSGEPAYAIARKGVAYIPQGNQLFPDMTVEQNLFLGVRNKKAFSARLPEVLGYFPALQEKLHHKAGWLSGGQQKFLAIGRALLMQPRLLLLDEPSEGIQPSIVRELAQVILSVIEQRGCMLLLVEQNRDLAFAVTKRTYIIDRGHVVAEGSPEELEEKGVVKRFLSF